MPTGQTPSSTIARQMKNPTLCTMLVKVICISILTSLAVVIVLSVAARPRIHSCQMHIPNKFSSFFEVLHALHSYASNLGWNALLNDIISIIRSEILDIAPYPEIRGKILNKHLLMIGGARTPLAFRRARQLGLSLIVVDDQRMETYVIGKAKQFIGIPDFGRLSVKNPEAVLDAIMGQCLNSSTPSHTQEQSVFDGIFTLVEDHGPITSFLAERLKLLASSVKSARLARNKFLMRQAMKAAGLQVPRFAQISSEADLTAAAAAVGFPAFLKPVYGVQVAPALPSQPIVFGIQARPALTDLR